MHLELRFFLLPFPRYPQLTNLLQLFDTENQKVGHIMPTKQVLLYTFCSAPETGLNALEMAFISFTVSEISTFDLYFITFLTLEIIKGVTFCPLSNFCYIRFVALQKPAIMHLDWCF